MPTFGFIELQRQADEVHCRELHLDAVRIIDRKVCAKLSQSILQRRRVEPPPRAQQMSTVN